MNGLANGLPKPLSNGFNPPSASQPTGQLTENGVEGLADHHENHMNGDRLDYVHTMKDSARLNGFGQMPPEILHITQGYLRLSRLVERSAQECWNRLADVVDK